MIFFEKQMQRCIKENFAEREKRFQQIEQDLTKRLNKSREYRIMLRDYQATLRDRETALSEREDNLKNQEATIKERLLSTAIAEKEAVQKEITFLKEQERALRDAEYTLIDWVSRMDKKESSVFDEIVADAEKYKKYQISIDGYEFEEYTATLLRDNNYKNVTVTQKCKDFGTDVVAEKDGVRYIFQCKYYKSQVGIEAVQQIHSAKQHYNAHVAVVVTNSVYTKAAKTLADELKVILWDCEVLSKMTKKEERQIDLCLKEEP